MNLTSTTGFSGLATTATPQNANVANNVKVGIDNQATTLSSATDVISFNALIVGASSDLVVDISDLDSTGTTAWTAGTAQVETATAVGTISGSGNATVTVTASGMTGSPKAISVAVLASDTASEWAAKVRTALAADTDVSALFTTSGTGADIVLTRKSNFDATFQGATTSVYPANDATLNIALANGTCTGITPDATSTDTTAGVATAGVYVPDLDGNDFEGNATGGATAVYGIMIENDSTSDDSALITQSTVLVDYEIPAAGVFQAIDATGALDASDITVEPGTAGPTLVKVTLATS